MNRISKIANKIASSVAELSLEKVDQFGITMAWKFAVDGSERSILDREHEFKAVMEKDAREISEVLPIVGHIEKLGGIRTLGGYTSAMVMGRMAWRPENRLMWDDVEDRLMEEGWL